LCHYIVLWEKSTDKHTFTYFEVGETTMKELPKL